MSDGRGFFGELKRRHVWRVAVAYAVAAWLLVQVATQVFPFFGIPDWVVRLVVILIVIGFPFALVLAWVYELTPEGIRRTEPADSAEARSPQARRSIGQRLNAIIMATLVLAVALMGWRIYADRHPSAQTQTKRTTGAAAAAPSAPTSEIPAKSVAVLPFANDSGAQDQQFFSDGLSEDLITALSQFAELKVISRNSAFQFRDSPDSSAQIGAKLGVAHLLEGSVQKQGDEVRITATLVNASDGTVMWTQRYDKPYSDLFALQDAITGAVADELKAKLLTAPGAAVQSDRPPSGSLAAWTAYQQGKAYDALNTEAGLRRAIDAYNDAIRLDPRYATAYAKLSAAWGTLSIQFLAGSEATHANAKASAAVATALRLDPDSSAAYAARAYMLQYTMDWAGAEAAARRALQLAPNDASAKVQLASILASLGQSRRAVDLNRQALASDPRHVSWYVSLGTYLMGLGQLDEAKQAGDTAIALAPGAADQHWILAAIAILGRDPGAALAAAQQEPDPVWREAALTLVLQAGPDRAAADAALAKLTSDLASVAAYQIAEVYALRGDAGNTFKWLDRAWANRDPGITGLLYDPFILRYSKDPRFVAFCKKVGLPTTTDAVAMK